jgi:type IV pilus assembly protein PilE
MRPRLSRPVLRRGFTLIELMVAMAALAILAAIALPAFYEQIARARRSDMQAAMLEDAAYLQHYYSAHDAFMDTPPPQLPAARAPRAGVASYTIVLSVPPGDPTTFMLTAQRTGTMSADPCGDFTYDSLGRRDLAAGTFSAGRSALACWR